MGHIFQVECWAKHPSRCSFGLLWLREISKGNDKGFEKARGNNWLLFKKIMENRIKGKWKVTGCMWGGKWRKNRVKWKNRGLNDKKAYENMFIDFWQLLIGVLSPFSLSLSHLKHSWITLTLEERRQRKDKKAKGSKYQVRKKVIKWLHRYYL